MHGYVSGGSEDQQALHANRDAFAAWAFRPQALVDVSARSQAVDLFGRRLPSPLGISPMGVAALCHHDGDLALARAAQAAGLPFVLSAASTVPLEEVMAAAPDSWYQAYLPADTAVIGPLLERIERAGWPAPSPAPCSRAACRTSRTSPPRAAAPSSPRAGATAAAAAPP